MGRDVALLVSAFYGSRCVHLVNQWIVIFIHIVLINRLFGYVHRNSFLFLFFFVLFYFVFYLFNVIYLWTRGDGRLSIGFFLSFFSISLHCNNFYSSVERSSVYEIASRFYSCMYVCTLNRDQKVKKKEVKKDKRNNEY